jgi:hypothetical protein
LISNTNSRRDGVAFTGRDGVALLDFEHELPEVDRLALHIDTVGDVRPDGRPLATDPFEELFAFVLLHVYPWEFDGQKSTLPPTTTGGETYQLA